MKETTLTSGRLARRAGVHVETIRYYERRGLLPRPRRTDGGFRLYDEEAVQRLRFVKRAQDLGFSLEEIRELLTLQAPGGKSRACAEVRRRIERKRAGVEAKIRDLRRLRAALDRLARACARRTPTSACPVLEALGGEEEEGS